MSIFRRRSGETKFALRLNARMARYVIPLIEKLCRDDCDGDAYRVAVRHWHRAERPVLDLFQGPVSLLRIDGPRNHVGDYLFPLGALIESPGVTAHLAPFEARELESRVRQAIEQENLLWIAETTLPDRLPANPHTD